MYKRQSVEGAIVFAVVPIFAKIIARIFLGEKSTILQNIFVVITVAALIVLIILEATNLTMSLTGIILMLAASISMAISNVFMRYVRGTFQPIEITRTIAIGGFVLFNIIVWIRACLLYTSISKIRSIPIMSAMPSVGSPTEVNTMASMISPTDGIPAVPMDAIIAVAITVRS